MTYHLILNPAAGRGTAGKSEAELAKELKDQLGDVHLHRTNARGHATQIANELKNENAVIITAGGDGTIYETVNGLVGGACTLGIIPIGSGNDFIKMLKLPLDIRSAIEVIKRRNTMIIDIGTVGEGYFTNGLGMGFDAEVVIETQKVKRLRGFFIYLYSVFRTLTHYKNRIVTISIDGKTETREVFMISVGNGECFGGGFYLTPGAEINDGILDLCIFRGLSRKEVLMHLPKALSGKHIHLPQVECLRAKNIIVEAAEGIPVHADGELLSSNLTRVEVGVLHGALNVIHNLP
jgi:YegS/Rv2252/BmrU family lipid kinase